MASITRRLSQKSQTTPISQRISKNVYTSHISGTFVSTVLPGTNKAAAIIGRAAFLDPPIVISHERDAGH